MNDAAIHALARRAGIAVEWRDYANRSQQVTIEILRRILAALGLPCDSTAELAESERVVGAEISSVSIAGTAARCVTLIDIVPNERLWGLAAQTYGLRSPGDFGIGDTAGIAACAKSAAARGADALALSPVHAGFAADPNAYSPYSPSSRLFYNPLYADARGLFGDRVGKAADAAGVEAIANALEQNALIDWPASAAAKMAMFRALFADFCATDMAGETALAADFATFRAERGPSLENHARFEVLHGERLKIDPHAWNWNDWPTQWRDPAGAVVAAFAAAHADEVTFHCFLQWIADRALRQAQQAAKQAGMRIGLIADLAVGMSGAGSHAWTNQTEILTGLEIGAPPDLFNPHGQNWGLTTFSPRALRAAGFSPFIETLRACLRYAGGVRIDHVMGLLRLWVIPRGAAATEGAYLSYPMQDLLRLTALESHRHRAIIIGEDLGTVPAGFRGQLDRAGIYGMRVLWFERERNRFTPPQAWPANTVAMTSTHDLPTIAGWWSDADIDTKAGLGFVSDSGKEREQREKDRRSLWRAFRRAKAGAGEMPAAEEGADIADAAIQFIAETNSDMAIIPTEDALALKEQPNLPGTVTEQPNWRRRYPGPAGEMLDDPAVRSRLAPLRRRVRS